MQKGYQMTGPVTGTITTKLKGASRYNGSHGDYSHGCAGINGDINRTFDVGDFVIPPQVLIVGEWWEGGRGVVRGRQRSGGRGEGEW